MQPVLSPYMVRFAVWYLYLARHRARFARVMLTDVRDVLFQRNPFDFPFDGRVSVFLEGGGMTIGTDPHTGPLVRVKYGSEVLHEFESRPVACAGVTIGSTDSILRYLKCMIDESTDLVDNLNQGIHNVLLYRGAFDPVRVFRNDEGPVLTLGNVDPLTLRFTSDGCLVNDYGSVVNTLHQYDRLLGRHGIGLEKMGGTFQLTRTMDNHG